MRENRDRDAATYLRQAVDLGSADAAYLLGDFYAAGIGVGKDPVAAVGWYRKAAAMGSAESLLRLGSAYYYGRGVTKDLSQSIEWYTKASQRPSTRERALQRLPLLREEDRLDKEIAGLDKEIAAREKCGDTGTCQQRAQPAAAQKPSEPDPFAAVRRMAAKRNPANAQARASLESKLTTVPRNSDEAIGILRQISELDPKDDLALASLANRYSDMERWREAVEIRQRALSNPEFTSGEKVQFWDGQCRDLIKLSRPQEAVAACQASIALSPRSSYQSQLQWDRAQAGLQFRLAGAQAAAGNRSAALAAYEKAVALDGEVSLYQSQLNRYRAAVEPNATARSGDVLAAVPAAIKSPSPATQPAPATMAPSQWQVAFDAYVVGRELFIKREYGAAVAPLKEAVRLEPGHANWLHMLGTAQSRSGDPGSGLASLEKALGLGPFDEATVRLDMAEAMAALGRVEAARRAIDKAVALKPNDALVELRANKLRATLSTDAQAAAGAKPAASK